MLQCVSEEVLVCYCVRQHEDSVKHYAGEDHDDFIDGDVHVLHSPSRMLAFCW